LDIPDGARRVVKKEQLLEKGFPEEAVQRERRGSNNCHKTTVVAA
jgi:hypothetical protein